jgi:ribosomal protein S18 acetylase RimI-like enzyme
MHADYAALVARSEVWLAVDDTAQPHGLIVMRAEGDALFVENVAVAPGSQHRGIGRQLLAFAEQHAQACGLGAISLYTNARMTENLTFYPALGYIEVDRRHDAGFDRVYFRKPLR